MHQERSNYVSFLLTFLGFSPLLIQSILFPFSCMRGMSLFPFGHRGYQIGLNYTPAPNPVNVKVWGDKTRFGTLAICLLGCFEFFYCFCRCPFLGFREVLFKAMLPTVQLPEKIFCCPKIFRFTNCITSWLFINSRISRLGSTISSYQLKRKFQANLFF